MERKGFFLVIEGIDGAGGETQSGILRERLEKEGKRTVLVRYPDKEGEIGRVIYRHLEEGEIFPKEALCLLYIADFLKDKERILNALKQGRIVIADRYFTSTLVYQSVQGIRRENLLAIAEMFALPKPNLAILLDISPETSAERKRKEKGKLDAFEENLDFLGKIRSEYLKVARNNVFCEWRVVNAERSIEEVAEEIWKIVSEKINL